MYQTEILTSQVEVYRRTLNRIRQFDLRNIRVCWAAALVNMLHLCMNHLVWTWQRCLSEYFDYFCYFI